MTVATLCEEIEKDRPFYEQSHGGVTFSGGEVFSQDTKLLQELFIALCEKGIRINADTCGAVPYARIEPLLPYIDTFLYDIKLMDTKEHERWTGLGNEIILSNLSKLSQAGKKIWLRLPIIEGVNADHTFIKAVIEFVKLEKIQLERVNLLAYHNLGKDKYSRLNKEATEGLFEPQEELLLQMKTEIENAGIGPVWIGG